MDEAEQPGAAAPGEHGDGAGPREDLGSSRNDWSAPANRWTDAGDDTGGDPAPLRSRWRQSSSASTGGWADPISRYGIAPTPVAGTATSSGGGQAAGTAPSGGVIARERDRDGDEPDDGDPDSWACGEPDAVDHASTGPAPFALAGGMLPAGRAADTEQRIRVPVPRSGSPASRPTAPEQHPATPDSRSAPDASEATEVARHAFEESGSDEPRPERAASWRDWRPGMPTSAPPARSAQPAESAAPAGGTDTSEQPDPGDHSRTGYDRPATQRMTRVPLPPRQTTPESPLPSRRGDTGPGENAPTSGQPAASAWSPEWARPWADEGTPAPAQPVKPSPTVSTAPQSLPQRVPAEPDVPSVPEPPAPQPPAETPELARIATHLRREDATPQPRERPEGFDVQAILAAVRGVAGVRDASLRTTPAGAHSLRLDLADGVDPAEVSRQVARLLQERMGLAAAPRNLPEQSADTSNASAQSQATEHRPGTEPAGVPRRRRSGPGGRPAPLIPTQRAGMAGPTASGAGSATVSGSPGTAPTGTGTAFSGGQRTATEPAPSRPLNPGRPPGPRVIIDHVQVSTFGMDATVEVRLAAGGQQATGVATGPAVDGYVLRLCAASAATAVDELLRTYGRTSGGGRCLVEHAAVIPFGSCEVATVVVLLVCDGWVEQLAGSALVSGDPRQAVVRATLAAVNRRLEALLG